MAKIIVLITAVIAIVVAFGFGVYRFQQSSSYIRQGNDALKVGNTDAATEFYNQARDVFPYRPLVSQSLEALNLSEFTDTQYGETYSIPATVSASPGFIPPPSTVPSTPILLPPGEIKVPILMYHHIRTNPRPSDPVWAALNVTPKQLDEQLQYFASHNFNTITLDDLQNALSGKKTLPTNPIILTFDDGYSSFYDAAYPILKKYNLKATEFVITGVVGAGAYLNWNQIKEMDKSGLVSFGAHTRHHPSLVYLSSALAQDEIKGSKTDLEKQLKKPVLWFAYPFGSYNNAIIQLVKDTGFSGATSTIYGTMQKKETAFLMPRIMVDGRYSLATLLSRL